MRKMNIYARAVLFSLWRKEKYYGSETFFCSDKQIADDIGIHTDTVKRVKRYLAASGWIRYVSGKHEGKATEYRILRRHNGSKKFYPIREVKSPADSAPQESPADSRPSNIYSSNTSLAGARSDPVNTASICSSAAPIIKERLRSIEEIQREHPDACRGSFGITGSQFCAMWKDQSKEGGLNSERCL